MGMVMLSNEYKMWCQHLDGKFMLGLHKTAESLVSCYF